MSRQMHEKTTNFLLLTGHPKCVGSEVVQPGTSCKYEGDFIVHDSTVGISERQWEMGGMRDCIIGASYCRRHSAGSSQRRAPEKPRRPPSASASSSEDRDRLPAGALYAVDDMMSKGLLYENIGFELPWLPGRRWKNTRSFCCQESLSATVS